MEKYMLVCQVDNGEQYALFADTYDQAHDLRIDAECGMGAVVEVYERDKDAEGLEYYSFLFS